MTGSPHTSQPLQQEMLESPPPMPLPPEEEPVPREPADRGGGGVPALLLLINMASGLSLKVTKPQLLICKMQKTEMPTL